VRLAQCIETQVDRHNRKGGSPSNSVYTLKVHGTEGIYKTRGVKEESTEITDIFQNPKTFFSDAISDMKK
jgi:hypothetical protein